MKNLLLFLAMILTVTVSFAQDQQENMDADKERPNGIRAGYQLSNLVSSDDKSAQNVDGFYVGFLRKVGFSGLFRMETGLEYMMAGSKITDSTLIHLHYLVLPAQFVLKIGPFYGLVGANANIKLAQDLKVNGTKIDNTDANHFSTMDVAVDAGAGFNLFFLSLEARYYWGLVDVRDGYMNRYAQVGLKLHF